MARPGQGTEEGDVKANVINHSNLSISHISISKSTIQIPTIFEISKTLTWVYCIITKEQLICFGNNVNDLVPSAG